MAPVPVPKEGIGLEGVPHFDAAILKSQVDATETTQLKLPDASLANIIETAHKGLKISYLVGKPGSSNVCSPCVQPLSGTVLTTLSECYLQRCYSNA